jgi:anti-anti-sigma regulatory factor
MKSNFRISSERTRGAVPVTLFHLYGWLDFQGEDELLAAARTAYDEGARDLLIDMGGLETLTSAGMRALQKMYLIFTPNEEHFKVAHVKLCNVPAPIYHLLGITGFLDNIPVYENVTIALRSFGSSEYVL